MSSSGARPGPRPRHTREEVLAAALRVIDAGPPDGFTMRRLADELGMGVMTLYGYVRNREEVIEGVTVLAFAESRRAAPAGAGWQELVRAELAGFHQVCRRHPNLLTIGLTLNSSEPDMFRMRERLLGVLLDAGFNPVAALHALGMLLHYAVGFGDAQAGWNIDLPERIQALPPDEFPRLTSVADQYPEHLSDAAFSHGLELLIAGLAADLSAPGGTG